MEVQICLQEDLIRDAPEIPEPERLVVESGISFHEAQAQLAQETGFKTQSELHRRKVREFRRQLLPMPPFLVVSEAEYRIWRLFLPTSYSQREWANYHFDLIPPDVLEAVRVHGHLFEEMEIRTPEVRKSDPVIFGTRGGVRYIVARWAESRLIPFEEVEEAVLSNLSSGPILSSILSAISLGLVALVVWVDLFFLFLCVPLSVLAASAWCGVFFEKERKRVTRVLASSAQPVTG